MRSLLFLSSQKSRLFYLLLFFLTLSGANLIITPKTQAQRSNSELILAQQAPEKSNSLEKKGKSFIELLSKGNYQESLDYFSPELKNEVKISDLERLWNLITKRYGQYKNISNISYIDAINVYIVELEVNFEKTSEILKVVFNPQGQVIGINIPQDKKDETVENLANMFVNSLAKGDYLAARSNLNPFLKAEFTPEIIRSRWETINKRFGSFKQISHTKSIPGDTASQSDIAIVTIEFNDTVKNMIVIFDKERQIVGVDFENMLRK